MSKCPQVEIMELKRAALHIHSSAEYWEDRAVQLWDAVDTFITLWDDDRMPDDEWDTKLNAARDALRDLRDGTVTDKGTKGA